MVNGITAGVQEIEMARRGIAVLMNYVCNCTVIDFGYVSFKTLWVKLKFSRVKVCYTVVYGTTEGVIEETT